MAKCHAAEARSALNSRINSAPLSPRFGGQSLKESSISAPNDAQCKTSFFTLQMRNSRGQLCTENHQKSDAGCGPEDEIAKSELPHCCLPQSFSQPRLPQTICSYDRAVEVFKTISMMPDNEAELAKWHSDLLKQVNALVEQPR